MFCAPVVTLGCEGCSCCSLRLAVRKASAPWRVSGLSLRPRFLLAQLEATSKGPCQSRLGNWFSS